MLNIVYSSTATKEFSRRELAGLLAHARAKNTEWGITGLLLYKRGIFMQALEGEEAMVRSMYATIRSDPRHHQIVTLVDIPVAQPRFPDWSMGFEDMNDVELDASGHQSLVNLPPKLEFPWRGSVAMQFLTAFWGSKEFSSTSP